MKSYDGKDIKGWVQFTYKIDGVQAIRKDGVIMSRAEKPLYNVPDTDKGWTKAEVYTGTFKGSIVATRTRSHVEVEDSSVYPLEPFVDPRLIAERIHNPTADYIGKRFKEALEAGYEGLVLLVEGKDPVKIKPFVTTEVIITEIIEGTGKNIGKLGAFMTNKGKVGTGLTDADRVEYYKQELVGSVIEVKAMSETEAGKLRHPVFLRFRPDRNTEGL